MSDADTTSFEPTHRVSLGRTSVQVDQLSIGTVPLSGLFEGVDHAESVAILEAGWDNGNRTYDLAPLYGYGLAERVTGQVLGGRPRDELTISTKVGRLLRANGPAERADASIMYHGRSRFPDAGDIEPSFDFTYDGVMRSIEESRERSGFDRFDILHIHDPEGYLDEALDGAYRALDELRSAGVVGAIGVGSNFWQTHVEMAKRGDFDCFLLAGRYSLLDQSSLAELLPLCESRGIAVIAAGVFNSGILTHPDPASIADVSLDPGAMGSWKESVTFDYEPASAEIIDKAARIKAVCDRHDVPLAAAAEQFPLHHPVVPCVLIGPRTAEHVSINNEWLRHPIPDDLWAELKHEGLLPEAAPTP